MMRFKKTAIAATLAVMGLLSTTLCAAGAPADNSKKEAAAGADKMSATVATVNGSALTEAMLTLIMNQRAAQGMPDTPDTRKEMLDQMIKTRLLAEEAAKAGVDQDPAIAARLNLLRNQILARQYVEHFVKEHPLSDQDLQAAYEQFKTTLSPNEYHARHILVAKEKQALDIIAKLKKDPKAFAGLAKKESLDPGSKSRGGDLDWFDPQKMVPPFAEAVKKLEQGKFTDTPVQTQFGFHVIMLDGVRPAAVPEMKDVREQLEGQAREKQIDAMIDGLVKGAKIEMAQPAAQTPAVPATAAAPAAPAPQSAPQSAPAAPAKN